MAKLAETFWWRALGPEYIERALVAARAADEDAILLINETGAEPVNEKSTFLYELAAELLAEGVPLDGIGLQFHVTADAPPDPASVVENLERFAALGLAVWITELDVSLADVPGTEEERLALQAEVYVEVLESCLAVPACDALHVFGFSDRYAWDELGDATPLLFTEDYEPKPAFFALQEALSAR